MGLQQKATARVAVETLGEYVDCNVGKVTIFCLTPSAEPRNGDKNRSISEWKTFCEACQYAGKLSGQLILTLYLHLQYGLSQCSFIPVRRETRRMAGSEMAVTPPLVAWSE
jgi:hypothetical protein